MGKVLVRSGKPCLDFASVLILATGVFDEELVRKDPISIAARKFENDVAGFLEILLNSEDTFKLAEKVALIRDEKDMKMLDYLLVAMISEVKDNRKFVEAFVKSVILFAQIRMQVLNMLYHVLENGEAKVVSIIAVIEAAMKEDGAAIEFDLANITNWVQDWKVDRNLAVRALKISVAYLEKVSSKYG
jgi:hypothetical protein